MSAATLALAALTALSPPSSPREYLPGWEESPEARAARYASIAADVGAVADEACAPKGDGERPGCARTALGFLVGIAVEESGLRPDVDAGRCYRGPGHEWDCDGGDAHGLWQVWASAKHDPERAALLDRDRRAGARAALRQATFSWRACGREGLPAEERLAAYAAGTCHSEAARRSARVLWAYVRKALAAVDGASAAERAAE